VIGCAKGELERFIINHGVGIIVPPEDPEALTGAIIDLAEEQRSQTFGQVGKELALSRFTRKSQVRVLADIMEQVTSKH
jgi:glycosyltransferase involved in cell wall biosynthesis